MFRHCVMMAFTDGATDDQKATAIAGILGLTESIPQIRSMSVGSDAGLRDDNFDVVAVVDFDDQADYETYAADPTHLDMLGELVRPILAGRAAVQYEL